MKFAQMILAWINYYIWGCKMVTVFPIWWFSHIYQNTLVKKSFPFPPSLYLLLLFFFFYHEHTSKEEPPFPSSLSFLSWLWSHELFSNSLHYIHYHHSFKAQLSQIWPGESPSGWFWCVFVMSSSVLKFFLTFWHKMFQAQELIPSLKARENKNKNKQMGPNKTFKFLYSKGNHLKKKKKNLQNERKYLPTTQVIRSSFPKYTNSSYNSTTTKKTPTSQLKKKKMGRRPK